MTDFRSNILDLIRFSANGQADKIKERALTLASEMAAEGDVDFESAVKSAYEISRGLPMGLYPLKAKKRLDELDLSEEVLVTINDFLFEQAERETLLNAKRPMYPRHKILLIGPPGNGKTVLAGGLALALGWPSYMVRYDDLISKIPGETSRNLLALFSWAAERECLLFFDEFDALGRERGDAQESGEMKRVTSTLLVQIDDIPSNVVCIAATNHAQMLDAAIWRRFNIRLELPRPRLEAFPKFISEYLESIGYPVDQTKIRLDIVAHRALFENFSDGELWASNGVRQMVLSKGKLTLEDSLLRELDKWTNGQRKVMG